MVGTAGNGQNTSTNSPSENTRSPENDGGLTEPEKNTEEDPSKTEERPIDRLRSEITGVQNGLKQAIMNGEFAGLPDPLVNYYEAALKNLYAKFNVVGVELVHGELEGDDSTLTMKVTAQIRYLQKGRDHPVNDISIPGNWVWTNGEHGFVLSEVHKL
ncbi:MAG: hypothetical protein U5K69_00135 [Balneolaceae bacterium]|nr:hypothetical protein [Balneolaceae bacterium]